MKKMSLNAGSFAFLMFLVLGISSSGQAQYAPDSQNVTNAGDLDKAIEDAIKNQSAGKGEPEAEVSPDMYKKEEIVPPSETVKTESTNKRSAAQNAVLEGIQISSEPGEVSDEKIYTCYFIFRDKPTSYFYEAKQKEKIIVFEFNDVELGASPIPSVKELPIQGFRIETDKVDANKEVVGLTPEWHDIVKVNFYMDGIPQINVKDEYSVISFSFKWSTNPEKQRTLIKKETNNRPLVLSLIGGAALVAGGVVTYFLVKPETTTGPQELDIKDLPKPPNPHP
jgi:hypothetical protein